MKTYQNWKKDEVELLERVYPTHNITQILEYFPTRTAISIQRKVAKLRLKKLPMKLSGVTKTQMAYLAGFFDGEGCVTIRVDKKKFDRGRNYIVIIVTNTNREVLEHFRTAFGGGSCCVTKKEPRGGRVIGYQWTASGERAYLILKAIYPYSRLKIPQIEVAMNFHERRLKVGLGEMYKLASEAREKLMQLNLKKGRRASNVGVVLAPKSRKETTSSV